MAANHDRVFFRSRDSRSVFTFALLSFVLFLLFPTHPGEEDSHAADRIIGAAMVHVIYKTYGIFSILESHPMELSKPVVWDVARTILEESEKRSLDPMLVLAVINVESRFQHRAVSPKGARGLMQIRPFVAHALVREMELQTWKGEESLDDPVTNIKLGIFYLGSLLERFKDLQVALTGYQWGPTEVRSRLDRQEALPLGYAGAVLASYSVYKQQAGEEQNEFPTS